LSKKQDSHSKSTPRSTLSTPETKLVVKSKLNHKAPVFRSIPKLKLRTLQSHVGRLSDLDPTDPSFQDGVSLGQSLIDLNTVYRFRLSSNSAACPGMPSSVAGILDGYQTVDPSGSGPSTWTANEWASLIALFAQVRFKSFSVTFLPDSAFTSVLGTTATGNPLAIGSNLSSAYSLPGSYAVVMDNADAKLYCLTTDRMQHGYKHTIHAEGIGWAATGTPSPGSYAGTTGFIQFHGRGYPVSLNIGYVWPEGVYEFRSRV